MLIACAGLLPLQVYSQGNETILLRNVTLPGQAGGATVSVNILIKNSLLDIITEDLIPLGQADRTFDVRGGVILGNLKLGEPANFLILDGDPRENLDLILDTKQHTSFAMYGGEVVKNNLVTVIEETPEEKQRAARGWLAYAPPPLAVPLNYQDENRWNRYDGDHVAGLFVGALVLDRMYWIDQSRSSAAQVGDLTEFEGGEIRALRFGGVGTLNFDKPWVWTLLGATHAFDKGFDAVESDEFTMFDVRLDIPLWERASFSIGKQKEPISMERIMAMTDMPMQERAAVSDALLPSRNVGMVMAGNLFDERMTLAGGVFNNWLDKDQPGSPGDNSTQLVGRATWLPLVSSNESTILHLGAGYRFSNGKEGFETSVAPEFKSAPGFVATVLFAVDELVSYQGEASLRSGPFWLHSEYIRTDVERSGQDDLMLQGYHITASWIVTGEVRPYNKNVGIFGGIPIARAVNQNGPGAWELSARFSQLDLSEAPGAFGGDAGEMNIWSAGLTWLLNPYLNVFFNYRYITLNRSGEEGTSHGFNMRVVIALE